MDSVKWHVSSFDSVADLTGAAFVYVRRVIAAVGE